MGLSVAFILSTVIVQRRMRKRPLLPIAVTPFDLNVRFGLPFQPVDATHWLNRSAGVSKSNVFLGRSLSSLATQFRCACE